TPCVTSVFQPRPNLVLIAIALILGLLLLLRPLVSPIGLDRNSLVAWLLYPGISAMFVGTFLLLLNYSDLSSLNVDLLTLGWAISPELILTAIGVLSVVTSLRRGQRQPAAKEILT